MRKHKFLYYIISFLIIAGISVWLIFAKLAQNTDSQMPNLEKEIAIKIELPEEYDEKLKDDIKQIQSDLKKNTDNLQNWLQYGLLLKSAGDYEGAKDAWSYASHIRPSNSVSFHNLGDLYHYYLKDFEKSEENYLKALENNSSQLFTYNNLYELYRYSWKEKAKYADDILLQGIKANPADPYLMVLLGIYYEETNDNPNAVLYYEKALELNPGNEILKKDLENLKN